MKDVKIRIPIIKYLIISKSTHHHTNKKPHECGAEIKGCLRILQIQNDLNKYLDAVLLHYVFF